MSTDTTKWESWKNSDVKSYEDLTQIIRKFLQKHFLPSYYSTTAGRYEILGRTESDQKIYDIALIELAKKYGSVTNYLKETIIEPVQKQKSGCFLIKPNDFPYAIEHDILHYILWSTAPLPVGSCTTVEVSNFILESFGNDVKYLWLVNPTHLQSIPSIFHGHIFAKKNTISKKLNINDINN
ncbi:hypothetical protein BB561_001818 [Smittium simulii]|uniref:Uncharacterized protein n=1 Tax=Smittium simulii TaxID=133385 RepID=A0A2T9YSX5_9FUNG|nr:hypothetical protein BB561_001818 [Smittium simulii]